MVDPICTKLCEGWVLGAAYALRAPLAEDDGFYRMDFTVGLINATVQLEQDLGNGTKTVGTGFLVSAPTPAGAPRTVLITSGHVFDRMPKLEAKVGWRLASSVGDWRYAPGGLTIRAAQAPSNDAAASATPAVTGATILPQGRPLWIRHPSQDIAAITVQAPPTFAKAAIPLNWLADDATFASRGLEPGDEMMALGFPRGLSSNRAGFPILRWGRVASYPLWPVQNFPTFLMDFRVFDGNSGGPVFLPAEGAKPGVVAGVLVKQVESRGDRLEIGVVVHARHVREAIAMLDSPAPVAPVLPAAARPNAPASKAPATKIPAPKTPTPVGVQPDAASGRRR